MNFIDENTDRIQRNVDLAERVAELEEIVEGFFGHAMFLKKVGLWKSDMVNGRGLAFFSMHMDKEIEKRNKYVEKWGEIEKWSEDEDSD